MACYLCRLWLDKNSLEVILLIRGIEYSQNGLESNARSIEMIANNLANVNSIGFKKCLSFTEVIKNASENPQAEGTVNSVIDFSQGELRETGNKLDFAISGPGFFSVQTDQGILYTRQGNFTLNEEKFMTTSSGDLVLGQGGPILIDNECDITENGAIISNGDILDYLSIVNTENTSQLQPVGNGYFKAADESIMLLVDQDAVHINSGYLENSNVDPMTEMVSMIEIYRRFEANQKAIQAQDQTLDKAVNDIGVV